jgi:sterol desaturase/sphingolipid hydroxylase (fatty acid hydroxylase superfamily)
VHVARFLLGWLAFVAWAVPVFAIIERPRGAPPWRAIALAVTLLAIDLVVTVLTGYAPAPADLARALVALAVAELLAYLVHRAMHTVPLLWRFHRLHHADEPIAWHLAWRIHPVDTLLFVGATSLACVIAGAPLPAAAWFVVGRRAWTVLIHSNVPWRATALDHVVATPTFHHRHHREDLSPANFAGTFAFLDRLFGTWAR